MYLIANDYQRVIQTAELNAITNSTPSFRQLVEQSVLTEIFSYLMQRFDVSSEFTDTIVYSPTVIYKANNRVYLDATAYDATKTYSLQVLTLYGGAVYICSTAIAVAEAFTPAHWTLLGNQYDIFFVTSPVPLFDQDKFYYKGDLVFWRDKIYQAAKDSMPLDQQDELQIQNIESINFGNIIPDDRVNGKQAWGTGITYAGIAGLLPTNPAQAAWSNSTAYIVGDLISYGGQNYICIAANTNKIPDIQPLYWALYVWTKGDNRNQRFITIYCDMVVYDLSKRISPNNVPEARHNAWLKACKDLEMYANGKRNAQLPILQPKTGNRVQFGGIPFKDFDVI